MKVQQVASPHAINSTNVNPQYQADARAKAIAKLQPQAQQEAVANPSRVSPEEMSAIVPKSAPTPVETTKIEVAAPKEEKQQDPQLVKQYQMLAKRERALREQAKKQAEQFKQQEAQLQQLKSQLESKDAQFKDYIPRQQLKDATLQALTEAGVSYDDVVQQVINQQAVNPQVQAYINKLEGQLKDLNSKFEDQQNQAKANQDAQYQAAVKQIEMDARSLVKTDATYEAIRKTGSVKDVVELIQRTFEEEGRVMSVQEAADEVENYLVEQIDSLTKIEKIKKRLNLGASQPKSASSAQNPDQTKQTQTMKTLTNATSSTRQLSARERALLAFEGKLNR